MKKRMISLLLVVALVFSLNSFAWAEDKNILTVDDILKLNDIVITDADVVIIEQRNSTIKDGPLPTIIKVFTSYDDHVEEKIIFPLATKDGTFNPACAEKSLTRNSGSISFTDHPAVTIVGTVYYSVTSGNNGSFYKPYGVSISWNNNSGYSVSASSIIGSFKTYGALYQYPDCLNASNIDNYLINSDYTHTVSTGKKLFPAAGTTYSGTSHLPSNRALYLNAFTGYNGWFEFTFKASGYNDYSDSFTMIPTGY